MQAAFNAWTGETGLLLADDAPALSVDWGGRPALDISFPCDPGHRMLAASVLGRLHGYRPQDGADRVSVWWFMVATVSDTDERISSTSTAARPDIQRRPSMSERRRASIVQQP